MSTASISVFFDKRRQKLNGEYPVKLIVYSEQTKKLYSFTKKVSLSEQQWEKINAPRLKQEDLLSIKNYLEMEKGRASKIVQSLGEDFSYDLFEESFFENKQPKIKNKTKIYSMFEEYIKDLREEKRISTAISYETAMHSLQALAPELVIKDITPKFLEKYEKWLLDKGSSVTTVGIYMRTFRTIINIAKEKKLFTDQTYPFGPKKKKKYEIPDGKNIKKALTIEDVQKIKDAECSSDEARFARDMWLFSFYCNGMNMKDVFSLKYDDIKGDYFYFNRLKTIRTRKKIEPVEVFITEPIDNIIKEWGKNDKSPENYIFNIFKSSMTEEEIYYREQNIIRQINGYLKKLGKQLEIKTKLTTYVARHSWATIIRNMGTSVEEISEGLGHSNIATTKNYLDSFPKEQKKATANKLKALI